MTHALHTRHSLSRPLFVTSLHSPPPAHSAVRLIPVLLRGILSALYFAEDVTHTGAGRSGLFGERPACRRPEGVLYADRAHPRVARAEYLGLPAGFGNLAEYRALRGIALQ